MKLLGITVAVGIGALLFFLLITAAWAKWGAFGMLIFFGLVLIGFAYITDRRTQRRYEDDGP